jgi:hypothetical protein
MREPAGILVAGAGPAGLALALQATTTAPSSGSSTGGRKRSGPPGR